MTTRFEAEPFGTQGLFHIVRIEDGLKSYLRRLAVKHELAVTKDHSASLIATLEHGYLYPEHRWIRLEPVYQGGHQYPSMLAATIAK